MLLGLLKTLMMKHSVCSSISQCKKRKETCAMRSSSSQDSNHPAGSSVDKNMGSNVGLKASATITSESYRSAKEAVVGPLSGKPFFTYIMMKTQVQPPYHLVMPTTFYSYLPNTDVHVVLTSRNKRWEIRYFGSCSIRCFDGGWKHFTVDNNLRIGDGCVFKLIDDKNLRCRVEAIKKISEYVAQLRRIDKGHVTWHFDQMLPNEGVVA